MTESALEVVSCMLLYASHTTFSIKVQILCAYHFHLLTRSRFRRRVRSTHQSRLTPVAALSDATDSTVPRLVQTRNERRHVCVVVMWVYPSDWSLARQPQAAQKSSFCVVLEAGYHLSGGAFEVITTRRHWGYAYLSSRARSRSKGNLPQ